MNKQLFFVILLVFLSGSIYGQQFYFGATSAFKTSNATFVSNDGFGFARPTGTTVQGNVFILTTGNQAVGLYGGYGSLSYTLHNSEGQYPITTVGACVSLQEKKLGAILGYGVSRLDGVTAPTVRLAIIYKVSGPFALLVLMEKMKDVEVPKNLESLWGGVGGFGQFGFGIAVNFGK